MPRRQGMKHQSSSVTQKNPNTPTHPQGRSLLGAQKYAWKSCFVLTQPNSGQEEHFLQDLTDRFTVSRSGIEGSFLLPSTAICRLLFTG